MNEPDLSSYSAEELFNIMVMQAKFGGLDGPTKNDLWTMYGRGDRGGSHYANCPRVELIAEELRKAKERHTQWLHVVIVRLIGGSDRNGNRQVVFRSSPEAKAWWE